MSQLIGTLHPVPPYDFLNSVHASRYSSVMGIVRDGAYWRVLRSGWGIALVKLANAGTVDAPVIDVYVMASDGDIVAGGLLATVRRMLDIDHDLRLFYALAQTDASLWSIVEPLRGLRYVQSESLFEALAITIIEQQISLAAARRAERWLVQWAGDSMDYEGTRFYAFPSAGRLATASVSELTPLKITFRRMQAIIDIAQMEIAQSFERWRDLPADEVYAELIALKGVGHWTAAWVLIRGLGYFRYVGSADVALRAAVNHYFYGEPGRCAPEVMDAVFAQYGEYAGLAGYYTIARWALERYEVEEAKKI
jgi:DNA-3-methyladenine glycosylase II